MPYRKHIYTFLIFIFTLISGAFAQETADFRVLQSQSNDTLYLKFELKRTSATPLFLGGYNLVFKIDPAVVDTNNFVLVDQGVFGSSTTNYTATQLLKLKPGVFQVALSKKFPITGAGLVLQDLLFQNVGIAAFKIKKCGVSGLSFPTQPVSSVIDWILNDVVVSSIPISPLSLSSKVTPKPILKSSKPVVCVGSSVDFVADSNILFSNYTLFSKSKTGVVSSVGAVQTKSVFKNIVITDTASYFVTFDLGTCKDTTTLTTVFTSPSLSPITITASNNSPCLGDVVTYTAKPLHNSGIYTWKFTPANTQAEFIGLSSGSEVNSAVVIFKGNSSYAVTISVQDTNSYGCAGAVITKAVNPIVCSFNADFQVNGSNFSVSSCQGTQVIFKDASIASGGLTIKKWKWDFGPGATPSTYTDTLGVNPPPVQYSSPGVVGVKLVVTNNLGIKDSVTKSPTITILSGLSESPDPTCGSASCNEVNFNWPSIQGATKYEVRYKKNGNAWNSYRLAKDIIAYKVTKDSVGGSLAFNDIENDTIYFQVRAIANNCDTTFSPIVFCRPSYCITQPGCNLPPFSINPTVPSCIGSAVSLKVNTTPKDFYNQALYKNVRFSWDYGKFDTSHSHVVTITESSIQNVKLLVIDTTLANCYSLNTISIPVSPFLTTKPDLGIQSLECDRVTFVWKHVEGFSKYVVEYSGSCISSDSLESSLGGQAEFYELTGLTDSCKINFNVKAVGGCNVTKSDTLISPPTCTCYIGHIASSNTSTCALDTVTVNVSNIQVPNWHVSWYNPITKKFSNYARDSVFRFVPDKPNTTYNVLLIIKDLDNSACNTIDTIKVNTGSSGDPFWSPLKTTFCQSDALYNLEKQVANPGFTFLGNGVTNIGGKYYFDASLAGVGTHTISYNACGVDSAQIFHVVSVPCVSTVVDAGILEDPNGIYTTCSGTIYITDGGDGNTGVALFKYDGSVGGVPQKILESLPTSSLDTGNVSVVKFGIPAGIVMDETTNNEVYFVDNAKHKIKKFILDKQKVLNLAGKANGNNLSPSIPSSTLSAAQFLQPWGLSINPNADILYLADEGNRQIKELTFKNGLGNSVKLIAGTGLNTGLFTLPQKGKSARLRDVYNIAADSLGLFASDFKSTVPTIYNYTFSKDSINRLTRLNNYGYQNGIYSVNQNANISGITSRIGDWVYFTDQPNFNLRRLNIKNGYMETVAGDTASTPSNFPLGASGLPFDARFSDPRAIAFNIKGYIDILDGAPLAAVRRYYIPRWGETWTGFDTTYVAKCDRDTVRPVFGGGRLRVISGKDLTAVINDSIFAPKDTGQYLLGYYLKIGRCDTTFLQTVYVKAQPKLILDGDTVCADSFLLKAKTAKDTSVKYKWFGPTKATSIATADTARSIIVKQTGDYYLGIFYGKGKKCSIFDSAHVIVVPPGKGRINPVTPPLSAILSKDSARLCFGDSIKLSMDELSASQPKFVKFKWSKGDTIKTVFGSDSTTYTVEAIDTLGCIAQDTFTVVEQKRPKICLKVSSNGLSLPIVSKKAFVCKGNVFSLEDSCNASPKYDVKWQKRTGAVLTTVSNATSLSDTGTYILTVTSILNGNLCPIGVKDSVHVVYFVPNASGISVISPTSTFIPCKPDTFKVTGTSGFGKYVWYTRTNTIYTPIDTSAINSTTLKVNLNVSKVDSAYYGFIVQNPISGCFDTTLLSNELKVKLYPRITPDFIDTLTCVGNTTLFTPASVDSTQFTYNWDFGVTPTSTSIKAKTSFSYATYGTYQVRMIGWNKAVPSCKDTVTRSVKITTRPRLDLTIDGLADTAKYCSSAAVQAYLEAKVVTDVNAAGGPFTFKWQEAYPKGGRLDSSSTLDNTIASPQTRVGESSSLYSYKVSVTDSKNCVSRPDSVYARVSTPPVFTVDALPLSPICKGQTVTLTPKETVPSTFKYSYKWGTNGVALNPLDTFKAVLVSKPLKTVTYNLVIKNLVTLCESTIPTQIDIKEIQIQPFNIQAPALCSLRDSLPINPILINASLPYQFVQWTDSISGIKPITLYNPDSLNVKAWRDTTHTYRLVVRDNVGCSDTAFARVPASIVQPPAFSITKGKDTVACVGAKVKVSLKVTKGTAPFKFAWSKPNEVDTTDRYNPVISPTVSGTYVVTMTDANNCGQASETITITQYDMSVLATNDAITGLCKSSLNPNPSAKLEANITNTPSISGASYTYTWTNIGTNTNLNTNLATVPNVVNAGSYEVQVKNNLTGCVRKDTTSFKILNKPEKLNFVTGIPSITCAARTISLSSSFAPPVSSKADSITYRWKVGANPTFQTANKNDSAIVANLSTTDFGNVTFKVYAENKCGIDSSSKDVVVSGTPKPNSDLKGGVFCDTIVPLVASILADPSLNYKWSGPNNINTIISDDATRSITTKTPGKFWVLIYDKNNPGCNRLDSATIVINKAGKGAIQLVGSTAVLDSIKVCFDVPVNLEMREATTTQAKFKKFVWNTLKPADTTRSISAVGAKWFKVSATDSIGCVVTDSFKVEEQPRPIACIEVLNTASKVIPAVNKQVNVCLGDRYTVSDPCNRTTNSVLDSLIVTWRKKDANGVISSLNGATQTGSYTYIETISLRLKNGDVCPNSAVDSVRVIERPIPSISIIDTAADPFICNNEVFGLSAQPATFVKYYWYKTPSTSTTGLREPFDTTTSNTTSPAIVSLDPNANFTQIYEVEGVDQYGCVATSSSAVTKAVFPIPALDFSVVDNCLGIATNFKPDVIDESKYEYRWDFGDPTTLLDVSSQAIDSYLYTSSGTYKVRLSGQSKLSTKICNNYVEKLITIKDPAKLDLTVNGVADTLKICGTPNGVNLNAVINSSSQTWAYDWTEIAPLGGKLDSTNTIKGNNTAKPIVKSGETTSLYGYSVQATDAKNCVSGRDTTYVRVSVAPEFALSLISNDTVCKGETISISAINQKPSSTLARYKYVWDTSGVDLKVNSANLVSKPKKSVDYRFTVSDIITTCSIQKSVKVTVQGPLVSIDPIANPAPCAAPDSIGIIANILQGLPLQSIQWIDSAKNAVPTTLYNPKLLTVSAFRDSTRTYGLIIKDNIGCVDTTFVRVNASSADAPKFAVVNGSSKSSCVKTDVKVELQVITGRQPYSFVWTSDKNGTPAPEVNTTDKLAPIISTANISSYPKKYFVTFNDANNCFTPALDSVEINQPADMQLNIIGKADSICKTLANPNVSTNLQAVPTDIPSSSGATYNYVWRNIETDQIVSSGSSFLNNVTSSGKYEVEVTNGITSCVRKDTVTVYILNAPENPVITLVDPTISCNNEPVQLVATFNSPAKANKDDITFEWSVIGGSNLISSFDSSVVYIPNSTDIGDITFKVIAKNRCGKADTISFPKRLIAAAKAKLDVDAKEVSINKNVVFTNNSTNTDSLVVLKITDGMNHDFGKTPGGTFNHGFSNKGTYKAKLYVINQNGCDAEDSVTITVIDKLNLFVPNVFSPSANDENNRFLRVFGVNISPQSFNFMVYNRWGQLVYSTSDLYAAMNVGWDGNDSGGESQMGVYTYILTGKFNTGGSINQTGTVTLLR